MKSYLPPSQMAGCWFNPWIVLSVGRSSTHLHEQCWGWRALDAEMSLGATAPGTARGTGCSRRTWGSLRPVEKHGTGARLKTLDSPQALACCSWPQVVALLWSPWGWDDAKRHEEGKARMQNSRGTVIKRNIHIQSKCAWIWISGK